MQTPVLTNERIQNIVQSEVVWKSSRLASMQDQFSDSGVQIARFGNAHAFITGKLPDNPVFNRVLGLTTQDEDQIDNILGWYSENNIPCQIDLCPYQSNRDLLLAFAKRGLHPHDHGTVLYGVPSSGTPALPQHIVVREVRPPDLDLFSEVLTEGFLEFYEGSRDNIKRIAASTKGLYGRPGWHLYIAFVEETPAAIGTLYIQGQIASLAAGATIPHFRAGVGTTSQHNMERIGMHIAYVRSVWRMLER